VIVSPLGRYHDDGIHYPTPYWMPERVRHAKDYVDPGPRQDPDGRWLQPLLLSTSIDGPWTEHWVPIDQLDMWAELRQADADALRNERADWRFGCV
jgi:hypothetical protein